MDPYFSWGPSDEAIVDLVSWPPRSYSCTFCKREFRSAQALGGHMNVHRRDRARLRQIPPSLHYMTFLNPNPNPNPHLSPSYVFCPKGGRAASGVTKFDGFPASGNETKIYVKNSENNIVSLDLGIGLLGESKSDDLDLELRLGCA